MILPCSLWFEKQKKVTGLEEYIKKEKDESNEVAKYSQRQLHKIKDNADTLEILIRSLKVKYIILSLLYIFTL